ncbi:NitT/TauT family transport system substrate-binding protein [Arthrobacter ginsengisoli]|uniref:NitT/TauT family transport system substrate-binding protein n=1 Tax=Arthrobacter ginsengisoli TaxID=1356565 RepID=A0ABU1UHT3_9MICC|nr:ABC transporter substrate-binding protein [Arthrobacter ginsengisoli]MDR7084713.1 NitT/TauT family transport system substrate-binding protein [Arthrobacter ginsengisoli]
MIPLKVGYQEQAILSSMDFIAKENGIFAKRNLDVTMIPNKSGQNAVAALLRGDIDSAYGPQGNTVTALSQGECLQTLTSGHGNIVNIVARPGLPLPSKKSDTFPGGLADLSGKKVGVSSLGGATDRNTRLVLKAGGADVDSITFIAVGVGATAVTALQQGEVDAMASFPPGDQLFNAGDFQYVVNLVENPEKSPLAAVIISSPVMTCDFIQKNENAAMAYCKAQWDAWDFAADPANNEAVARSLAKYLSLDAAKALKMWEQYRSTFQDAALTPEAWAKQSQYNAADQQQPLDYAKTVYAPCAASDPR